MNRQQKLARSYLQSKLDKLGGPKTKAPRNGTVRIANDIDFTGDLFNRSAETHPGYYVWFGMWKGPFAEASHATDAYREWAWEAKHS